MKPLTNYPVRVFATGAIVLTLLSIPLFWFRFLCQICLPGRIPDDARQVSIQSSGLVPREIEYDPNVVHHSIVAAGMNTKGPFLCLGCIDYFQASLPGGRRSSVFFAESERPNVFLPFFAKPDEKWMYFDKKSGQFVYQYVETQRMPDGSTRRRTGRTVQLYVGPEGISEIPDKKLGRFIHPIVDRSGFDRSPQELRELILYDKKLWCFFKIDFNERTVIRGSELRKDDSHNPIQIGRLSKNTSFLHELRWTPPKIEVLDEGTKITGDSQPTFRSIIQSAHGYDAGPYLLVLDETGRIDLLDKESLEFAGTAGRLPAPETFFRSWGSRNPKGLLGYEVWPLTLRTHFFKDTEEVRVTFGDPSNTFEHPPSRVDRRYLGMFAASLSRDGTAVALIVFNEEGKWRGWRDDTEVTKQVGHHSTTRIRSAKAAFFEAPWAPALTIGKYLAENLHAPILSLASYFTASAFEASAGHRALFILPNSFIAMKGRHHFRNISIAERFTSALLLILPSIILAILLAWRVANDATVVGLSQNAKLCWMIGTIAFSLTAYITYRLTRPKITLVTCANCGNPRRPDMPKCHRCGSKWHVPELTPPTWRVLG